MSDDLSPFENRAVRGCDALLRASAAWLAGADAEHPARAAAGRAVGGVLATWFAGGLLFELGPYAWAGTGAVLALTVWAAGAATEEADDDEPDADESFAFLELVHDVAAGGNVHLSAIAEQLRAETGRQQDVLALCRQHGIPTRPVRVKGADPAVTTGVHRHDLPPLPRPLSEGVGGVVSAGEADNNNTDITKEPIGVAGTRVKHGSIRQEAHR